MIFLVVIGPAVSFVFLYKSSSVSHDGFETLNICIGSLLRKSSSWSSVIVVVGSTMAITILSFVSPLQIARDRPLLLNLGMASPCCNVLFVYIRFSIVFQ